LSHQVGVFEGERTCRRTMHRLAKYVHLWKTFNWQSCSQLGQNRSYCNQVEKNKNVEEPSVLKQALENLDFQTLFAVARLTENHGIGEKFYLDRWRRKGDFDSYWTVTRIQRDNKGDPSKFFGYYHYKGTNLKGEREIELANCKGWRCDTLEKERTKLFGKTPTVP